jgi:hypothetical protein
MYNSETVGIVAVGGGKLTVSTVAVADLPDGTHHPRTVRPHDLEEMGQSLAPLLADAVYQYYHGFVQSDAVGEAKDTGLTEHYVGLLMSYLPLAKQAAREWAERDRRAGGSNQLPK